jgi:transcriptional antiterminator RfaH
MEHWYVFHTKPHKERQVAAQLRQRRHEVFLPLASFHPAGAQAARERPYFPGYLFAQVDLEVAGPGSVQWLPGLRALVQFGGQPAILADHHLVDLKRRMRQIREMGGVRLEGMQRGTAVRITSGPFAGYGAMFDARLAGTERVRVLLEWVTRAGQPRPRWVPLELAAGSIEKRDRRP